MSEYRIVYYVDGKGRKPARDYVESLPDSDRAKVRKYMEFLRENDGYLEEPYSRHIRGKVRELRVDFARNRHRIFYFAFVGKRIIMLSGFMKNTTKTPKAEIAKALEYCGDVIRSRAKYEEEK